MSRERPSIERLELSGYKSVRHATIDFSALNVFIGANGAGKSNILSFFRLLSHSLDGKLDDFVGRHGGPNALLHLGAKRTSEISAAVTVATPAGEGILYQRFGFRAPDSLFPVANPSGRPNGADRSDEVVIDGLCSVIKHGGEGYPGLLIHQSLKDRVCVYHFLDTTLTAPVRMEGYIEDNKRLHPGADNLAAMLFLYRNNRPETYRRIRSTVRKLVPTFDDFVLEPQRRNPRNILLNWRQDGNDYVLGPHQLSDGSLRAIALVTLLLQPGEDLPDLVLVDEPELGLHPHAVTVIAGLFRSAATKTRIVVATQSATFVDHFTADEIVVAEITGRESRFRRLREEDLRDWLEDYSLGELWEKNVIGGGPLA
jgi:predicted ATPase